MKINDIENMIPNSDCYFCYSLNLHRFLEEEKEIHHINHGVHKKTKKIWFAYIKTVFLDEALKEWSDRKKDKNYYIERLGEDK